MNSEHWCGGSQGLAVSVVAMPEVDAAAPTLCTLPLDLLVFIISVAHERTGVRTAARLGGCSRLLRAAVASYEHSPLMLATQSRLIDPFGLLRGRDAGSDVSAVSALPPRASLEANAIGDELHEWSTNQLSLLVLGDDLRQLMTAHGNGVPRGRRQVASSSTDCDGSYHYAALAAKLMARHPGVHVRVEAHAGTRAGSSAASFGVNDIVTCEELSQAEARRMGRALVAHGVAPHRVMARGWGDRIAARIGGVHGVGAEIFFEMSDGVELPPRPAHYDGLEHPPPQSLHLASGVCQPRLSPPSVTQSPGVGSRWPWSRPASMSAGLAATERLGGRSTAASRARDRTLPAPRPTARAPFT